MVMTFENDMLGFNSKGNVKIYNYMQSSVRYLKERKDKYITYLSQS